MKLVYPEYLIWGLSLPLCITLLVLIVRRSRHALHTWFDAGTYRLSTPALKGWLRGSTLILALLALLGPYRGKELASVQQAGREVYFLLDLSASMNCEDIRPSRLHKAKREILDLLPALSGDLVGLIVFADQAYVQCPLTRDHQAFGLFLELADPAQFAQSGTNFRQPMALALERFLSTSTPGQPKSRAIVLLSDGEDFGTPYTSVIKRLEEQNIPLFAIGIGTMEGARVPNYVEGKRRGVKTHEDGTPVLSRLNEASLQALSDDFDTPYYQLKTSYQHLRDLGSQIRLLSATQLETHQEKVARNRYQPFLLPAILLWFFTLILMPQRKS